MHTPRPRPPRFCPVFLALAALLVTLAATPAPAGTIPLPQALAPRLETARDATALADAFLGIAYVDDATVDEIGRFTLFEHPDTLLPAPGLNCSGFVLSVSRFLLSRNITLAEATLDIARDSGPDAPQGRDWDFGFDLIRNITAGLPRRAILPDGSTPDLSAATGRSLRGFPIADTAAWQKVLPRLTPGHVYLASVSKPVRKAPYTLLHYHVGLILVGRDNTPVFYHATPKTGSHRVSLATPQGLRQLQDQFRDKTPNEKHILLIEAPLATR